MENIIQQTKFINTNSGQILEKIDQESIDVYRFLKSQFLNSDVTQNYLFQFVFRSFYQLDNAGLTPEFKTEYFKIFQEVRGTQKLDCELVLRRLYHFPNRKGQNTVQFSFVTKMFNLIDDSIPIYDSEVAKVFGQSYPDVKGFDQKWLKYQEYHRTIQETYNLITTKALLQPILQEFDKKFNAHDLPELKKLDFIFWAAGKLFKDGLTKPWKFLPAG